MKIEPSFHRHREILSGTPVFFGTRVPVRTLFDYLTAGHPVTEFLEDYPGVRREQVVAVLEQATAALLRDLPLANADD